ncbi:HlyD family efflux transporter periplasmic adaptor subunit [Roseibacterium sp. SDUM158016]|uniref:HlyD family secretion protein n=1 Tax=Roseicyclus sediminis TaxID=2980997 RepID=UPI0021D1BDBC|nr:HlyD family efflux transporter periplasmic adaptor subunit [Roseibacterium sp. SDUM158016]MCU4651478.1 HlyD family efflux transporter periplasmic adaptor subunit [Roseibacterium sp. SDUM158016]
MIPILKAIAIPAFVLPMLLQSCAERETDVALGIVMRERVVLTATGNAIITALPVAEGSAVAAGDVLVQLEDAVQQANLQLATARLSEAEADLERVRSGARDQEVAIAEARVRGARAVYEEAETTLERNRRLLEGGTITQARLDQDIARRDSALAELTGAEQALAEIREGAREEDIRIAEAHVAAAQAQVAAERTRLEDLTIRASRDGILDSLPWNLGERVPLGSPVAVLLTGDRPHARIYIPEPARYGLGVGDPVSIRLDGTEAVFEGSLRWISNEPAFTPYYALNQEQRSRLVYLAEVALPAEAADLPVGVPVTATLP